MLAGRVVGPPPGMEAHKITQIKNKKNQVIGLSEKKNAAYERMINVHHELSIPIVKMKIHTPCHGREVEGTFSFACTVHTKGWLL